MRKENLMEKKYAEKKYVEILFSNSKIYNDIFRGEHLLELLAALTDKIKRLQSQRKEFVGIGHFNDEEQDSQVFRVYYRDPLPPPPQRKKFWGSWILLLIFLFSTGFFWWRPILKYPKPIGEQHFVHIGPTFSGEDDYLE